MSSGCLDLLLLAGPDVLLCFCLVGRSLCEDPNIHLVE